MFSFLLFNTIKYVRAINITEFIYNIESLFAMFTRIKINKYLYSISLDLIFKTNIEYINTIKQPNTPMNINKSNTDE